MVVQEDIGMPLEVPVIKKPLLEQKSYVIVKNHVRELTNTMQNEDLLSQKSCHEEPKRKKCKYDKKSEEIASTSTETVVDRKNSVEIDSNDLEELKTVYKQCVDVMKRFETKYGHLLDVESLSEPSTSCDKLNNTTEDECQCKIKKKILFDEEGKQITVDSPLEKHICLNKIQKSVKETQIKSQNIEIEYQDTEIVLPENLQELSAILLDPNIDKSHRYKVIDKMRLLRQEYINDIRFNKHIIIDKLKSNADENLDFKGTNLSTISGYL